MRRADPVHLKRIVSDIVRRSELGGHLRDVVLEFDDSNSDDDLIRVIIELDSLGEASDDELAALISSIENSFTNVDERFPSIRFAEAA